MYWYEDEVKRVENEKNKIDYEPEMIFYGSSSITRWNSLYDDFKMFHPINLGFGGSTLEACIWFFQRVMQPFKPDHIVVYAGDNDLGDGKTPEEVFSSFRILGSCIQERFNNAGFTYISIKPSIARRDIHRKIVETNQLIKNEISENNSAAYFLDVSGSMLDKDGKPIEKLYDEDGLHLSNEGYLLWKALLLTHFSSIDITGLTWD